MALDIEAIRADFPILDRVLPNGKKLVYFDNAATSQKPQVVIDAMTRYYEEYNSNAHRANHTLADEATTALEEARSKISRYFGTNPENMIYTSGATEAINLVAYGWARYNLQQDDVVVITEMEHHADIVPWQELNKEKGVEVQLDPTLGTKYKLYSGLTFSLVSTSPSAPVIIAKGGRYDDLVKKFSSSKHNSFGIGFSISIDKIRELVSSSEEMKGINEKVLIAYKQSTSLYKALKQQKEWHNKGIISVISHEPLKTNDATYQLLKSNRCTKIEWID